jgi:hypothetical protein
MRNPAGIRRRKFSHHLIHLALGLSLVLMTRPTQGQVGSGWAEYKPERKIHLVDRDYPTPKGMRIFDWVSHMEVGSPAPCASYAYDPNTDTETFTLHDQRSNRSEIRLHNDYGEGSRQFEGYVTFYPPLNDESLMQIWGSDEGATQMMMRGYAANGGEIGISNRIVKGIPRVATNCYGREIKVNVIHLQEDVGNKFIVYLDDRKVLEFADDEKPTNYNGKNYHKYGCYGTLKTSEAVVKWRRVRHFKDGVAPDQVAAVADPGPMAIKGKLVLEEDFRTNAEYGKQLQPVPEGWRVRASHATWKRTDVGVQSTWESGHMPVLVYEGSFGDAVIEVDFRFRKEEGKWGGCRISASNAQLNPRAYAVSVWASSTNKGRPPGMVLEHDEWKPGTITTVDNKSAAFEPDTWYTLRLEVIGNTAQATCNGVTVYGAHEKFGLPKTSISLGTGLSVHDLRNFRVYEARPNPAWKPPEPRVPATP